MRLGALQAAGKLSRFRSVMPETPTKSRRGRSSSLAQALPGARLVWGTCRGMRERRPVCKELSAKLINHLGKT